MKYVKCKLLDGDNVIAENIDVLLEENQPMLKNWGGKFEFPITKNLEQGSIFGITLEDGRSGKIIISEIGDQNNKQLVKFSGSGSLK